MPGIGCDQSRFRAVLFVIPDIRLEYQEIFVRYGDSYFYALEVI